MTSDAIHRTEIGYDARPEKSRKIKRVYEFFPLTRPRLVEVLIISFFNRPAEYDKQNEFNISDG